MALDDARPGPLPCGTLLDDLIAQVVDGAAPLDAAHQTACRYCQSALEAIADAWEEFQSVAQAAVAIPEDLADRIIARIRQLARATGEGVLVSERRGSTRIADRVLARLARGAALVVPGVVLATVLSAEDDPVSPGSVGVSLRLVVALGPSFDELADAVRDGVIAEVQAQTGAPVSRVDIAIDDLVFDADESS